MLKKEFFMLLGDSVNMTAELLYRMDLSGVELLYIDKILSKKGHNCITMVCD